jgi:hypothetical protein
METKKVAIKQPWPAHVREYNPRFIDAKLIVPVSKDDFEVVIIGLDVPARRAHHQHMRRVLQEMAREFCAEWNDDPSNRIHYAPIAR